MVPVLLPHRARPRRPARLIGSSSAELLWRLWSPTWEFDDATYARSAASFDNPDFVEVVIHSYRHRYAYVAGDPALEDIERQLAEQPPISVPTVALHGADDGVAPRQPTDSHAAHFTGPYLRQVVSGAGHNLPQERPAEVATALLRLLAV